MFLSVDFQSRMVCMYCPKILNQEINYGCNNNNVIYNNNLSVLSYTYIIHIVNIVNIGNK